MTRPIRASSPHGPLTEAELVEILDEPLWLVRDAMAVMSRLLLVERRDGRWWRVEMGAAE